MQIRFLGSSGKKKIRKEKKEPGLLNLGRYSVSEWMACSILEDRLWPSDEKDLLKIFGNSVGSFESL